MITHSFDGKKHTSGVCSSVGINSSYFMAGLKEMFDITDSEMIVAMEMTKDGIKVYIEQKT